MGQFGGFYKGEKKKKRKDTKTNNASFSDRPVFTQPKMVEKKRRER